MLRPFKLLKSTTLASLFGFAAAGGIVSPASAHTYVRCDWDGDRCIRVICDWDGDSCWRQSEYYGRSYYYGRGRWACDEDGDSCRYIYDRGDYGRGYYDRDDDWGE